MIDLGWFALAVLPLLVFLLLALTEVIGRREDLTLPRRVGWVAALLISPPLALAAYAVSRPPSRPPGVIDRSPGHDRATRFVDLAEQRARGELDVAAYSVAVAALTPDPTAGEQLGPGTAPNDG